MKVDILIEVDRLKQHLILEFHNLLRSAEEKEESYTRDKKIEIIKTTLELLINN